MTAPTPLWNGSPLSPMARDALFSWLDQQVDAGARPGWTTAPLLAVGFDIDIRTARRIITAWALATFGTDDSKETP